MELTAEAIQRVYPHHPVRYYERLDSTNDLALAWLRDGAPAGAVIVADEQVKGRGRLGRMWHTPPGAALAVSVVLRPETAHIAQITMLGALAIYDAAAAFGAPQVGIKWPNDVQVNGRKICGVLPEAAWDGDQLLGVVLGMGVNVRVNFAGTELEATAISLESALSRAVNRLDVLAKLLERVDFWYARLGSGVLVDTWTSRLTTLGQMVTVNDVHGLAEAVDTDGTLLVRDAGGGLHRVVAGDVALGI